MEEHKQLVIGGNLLQAHTWKGLLESAGMQVELRGEALVGGVGELPLDMQMVELWVAREHVSEAQGLLSRLEVDLPQWQCVQCHEVNEGSFELCWQCGAEPSQAHN